MESPYLRYIASRELDNHFIHKELSTHLNKFFKKNKIYHKIHRNLYDFAFFIEADDLILFKEYFYDGLEGTVVSSDLSDPQAQYDRYVSYIEGMFSNKSNYLNAKVVLKNIFNNKYIKYLDTY